MKQNKIDQILGEKIDWETRKERAEEKNKERVLEEEKERDLERALHECNYQSFQLLSKWYGSVKAARMESNWADPLIENLRNEAAKAGARNSKPQTWFRLDMLKRNFEHELSIYRSNAITKDQVREFYKGLLNQIKSIALEGDSEE